MQSLLKSGALFEILSFLRKADRLPLQVLSRDFYSRVIPQSVYEADLSARTRDTLFSYSVEQGSLLYRYRIDTLSWESSHQAEPRMPIIYSMQLVVTRNNLVFLMGGAEDEEYNRISDLVYRWDLVTDKLTAVRRMPVAALDFGACQAHDGDIYCLGGYREVTHFTPNESTLRYFLKEDRWEKYPSSPTTALGRNAKCTLVSVGGSNPAIYAFFNVPRTFYKLRAGAKLWDRLTIAENALTGIWACGFWVPRTTQIFIFGGDEELLDQQPGQEGDTLSLLKVLETSTNSVSMCDIQMRDDFFYFNQVCQSQGRFFALGKDHVHAINPFSRAYRVHENDGDYGDCDNEV